MDWPTDEVTWEGMYAAALGKGSVSVPALSDDAFRFPEHSQPAPNVVSARKGEVGIEVAIGPGLADPDFSKTEALVKLALGHIPG